MLFPFVIFLIPCFFFLDTNTFCVSLRTPALSPKWSLTCGRRALGKHKDKPMGRTPHETMHFHRCCRVPSWLSGSQVAQLWDSSWAYSASPKQGLPAPPGAIVHLRCPVSGWCFTLPCVLAVSTAEAPLDLEPHVPCKGWQGHHLAAWIPEVSVILNRGPQPIP